MAGIADYSTTPNSNGSINGINIAELCPAANLNDAIRQQMADTAQLRDGAAPSATADAAKLWGGTNTQIVTPKSIKDASAWITIADAATITLDHAAGRNFTLSPSFGSNRALAALANPLPGQPVFFLTKQDGTGSRTLTVNPAQWIFPGRPTTAPLSPGANAVTMISGIVGPAGEVYANAVRFG